jgi:hypothetical protein
MSFESRCHRFVYVSDTSILNERVLGFIRLKHMLYLFVSAIFLWHGCSSRGCRGLILGRVASALYPRKR